MTNKCEGDESERYKVENPELWNIYVQPVSDTTEQQKKERQAPEITLELNHRLNVEADIPLPGVIKSMDVKVKIKGKLDE